MDNEVEIPEAWMPTVKKNNSRSAQERTAEGTTSHRNNNQEQNAPITDDHRDTDNELQADSTLSPL